MGIKKRCYDCKELKDITEFHKHRGTKDGLQNRCKSCRHIHYIEKDYIRVAKYGKKRYSNANKNLLKQLRKERYDKNKQHEKDVQHLYYINNKKHILMKNKEYRNSLAVYNSFGNKLTVDELPRLHSDGKYMEVRCRYCGLYFIPTNDQVCARVAALNNEFLFECSLYCSDNCKISCPTFGMSKYPKGFKKASSREVNPLIRQMCFERDGWICQICGKSTEESPLHCHHIEGYTQNPKLGNDIDNVITLCKVCHKDVHKLPGCGYNELRCDN